jgi:hypothetical protein
MIQGAGMSDFSSLYNELKKKADNGRDKAAFAEGLKRLIEKARNEGAEHWRLFLKGRLAGEKGDYEAALEAYDEAARRRSVRARGA